jgi:hypothetical protein
MKKRKKKITRWLVQRSMPKAWLVQRSEPAARHRREYIYTARKDAQAAADNLVLSGYCTRIIKLTGEVEE